MARSRALSVRFAGSFDAPRCEKDAGVCGRGAGDYELNFRRRGRGADPREFVGGRGVRFRSLIEDLMSIE